MMTTARAASSAMPSGASVPRRAAVLLKVVLREEEAQEEVPQEALRREIRAVVAVAQPATTIMITIHPAAEAEGEGDSIVTKPTKLAKLCFYVGRATARNCLPLLIPTKVAR